MQRESVWNIHLASGLGRLVLVLKFKFHPRLQMHNTVPVEKVEKDKKIRRYKVEQQQSLATGIHKSSKLNPYFSSCCRPHFYGSHLC